MGKRRMGGRGLAALGEDGIVDIFRKGFASSAPGVAVGIGDDAALVDVSRDRRILFTADHMAEGVHFTRVGTPPAALGYKLAAMNASDIGAMGGVPTYALLSLALPETLAPDFPSLLSRGLRKASRRFGFLLVGGDTTASRTGIFASLALLGNLAGKKPLTRSGARPGDALCVTGHLGASAVGLAALERGGGGGAPAFRAQILRHLWPAPPVGLGAALGKGGHATAAIDLSDGLSTDLDRLCRQSGVGAELFPERIPVRPSTRRAASALGLDAVEAALHGGEEYELLFTARPAAARKAALVARRLGVALTRVGTILAEEGIWLRRREGDREPLAPGGWRHF